jgi:hypothetical protein
MRLSGLVSQLRTIHEFLCRVAEGELKDGASRFVRFCPQPALMGIDDGAADRQAHSHSALLRGVESLSQLVGLTLANDFRKLIHGRDRRGRGLLASLAGR